MPFSDISLYSRQMLVPGFGAASQQILRELKVLLVGAGGLGCPVALYLVRAGVGGLTVVDGDLVEESNLHRQVLHDASRVGTSKAHSLVCGLQGSGGSSTALRAEAVWFSVENAQHLIQGHNLVVDATDNASTRYLLNDACYLVPQAMGQLSPVPLISGAALGLDGQLSVHHWGKKGRVGCYRCLFPTPPPSSAAPPCSEVGVLGPVTGLVGCLMALEVLKCAAAWARGEGPPILCWSSSPSNNLAATSENQSQQGQRQSHFLHTPTLPPPTPTLLCIDASEPRVRSIGKAMDGASGCILCGCSPTIKSMLDSHAWAKQMGMQHTWAEATLDDKKTGVAGLICPTEAANSEPVARGISSSFMATAEQINRAQMVGGDAAAGSTAAPIPLVLDIRPALHRDITAPKATYCAHLPYNSILQSWDKNGEMGVRDALKTAVMNSQDPAKVRVKGEEGLLESLGEILVLCRRGVDSEKAAEILRASGFHGAVSVADGLRALGNSY